MHDLEPYHQWRKYYISEEDPDSPFYGKDYNYEVYSDTIYGYYIDPAWDYFGSETLYLKLLIVDYELEYCIIEFIGEWNDAINNDIMHLKRNVIELLLNHGIQKFILLGDHVMNFHGSDDCYYEEWFEEVEEGWVAMIGFKDFVLEEMKLYNIDSYFNFGGNLQIDHWRTMKPKIFFGLVNQIISRRLTP